MPQAPRNPFAITPVQLRRLHALWRRWTVSLRLPRERDTALRHYYIELFSAGRARQSNHLSCADAARVTDWLENLLRRREARFNRAAGTAGRDGYPERRRVRPTPSAWRALWGCAAALGMDRARLDAFIRKRYAGAGLHSVADLRSMADLNRVLWGLKAMLRRGPGPACRTQPAFRKAA
jgi:hypothetical protein